MRKWVKAMTYAPKIDAVWNGDCTQTIRKDDKVKEGDEILFHTWEGLPYDCAFCSSRCSGTDWISWSRAWISCCDRMV